MLSTRLALAEASEVAQRDPAAAAAITSRIARRLERRGGFWTPLQAQALEATADSDRAAGDVAGELAARRALLALQPGRAHRQAGLGAALLRAGETDAGLALLEGALARDPNCLPALVPLVERAAARGDPREARRLVAAYERAPLLPQSLVASSRNGGIRLFDRHGAALGSWRCAPPIDGRPHTLTLKMIGKATRGEAAVITITISGGPSCAGLVLHALTLRGAGPGAPALLTLRGSSWPKWEVIGGNRVGVDRIRIDREQIRVGFLLPRRVPVARLDALELRLTLEKRFPPALRPYRSAR